MTSRRCTRHALFLLVLAGVLVPLRAQEQGNSGKQSTVFGCVEDGPLGTVVVFAEESGREYELTGPAFLFQREILERAYTENREVVLWGEVLTRGGVKLFSVSDVRLLYASCDTESISPGSP